jgi:hypothetical protein
MPVVAERQESRRGPRRWLVALGLAPVALLLAAVGFLAWLPSCGEDGVPLGEWQVCGTVAQLGVVEQGVDSFTSGDAGYLSVRLGDWYYMVWWSRRS